MSTYSTDAWFLDRDVSNCKQGLTVTVLSSPVLLLISVRFCLTEHSKDPTSEKVEGTLKKVGLLCLGIAAMGRNGSVVMIAGGLWASGSYELHEDQFWIAFI